MMPSTSSPTVVASPRGAATSSSPGRISHRLVKNPDTQLWGKEPTHAADPTVMVTPRRRGRGLPSRCIDETLANDTAQQVHSPSALEYFLSTSPRQQTKSLKHLLNTMDHAATKKLSTELELFEREHNLPTDQEEDEDDLVHSPRGPMGGRGKPSRGSVLFELNNPSKHTTPRLPAIQPASSTASTGLLAAEVSGGGSNALSNSGNEQLAAPQRSTTPPPPPPQEYLPGKRVPVVSTNPITGILCNVPLCRVFSVYREQFVRSARNRRSTQVMALGVSVASVPPPTKKEPLRVTVEDFLEMLRSLLPEDAADCVSREYARRMIEPFGAPSPYGGPPKVFFPHVFSYLCKCYGHPMVEKNVRFLIKCLDPKSKGGVPYAVLTGRVVRAWAENRVIGGAIHAWRALAAALEEAGDVDVRLLENPALVSRDELRMVSYTTQGLTEAMLLDLECDVTTAPRFPSLPSQGSTSRGSDDASSMASGGRRGDHRSRTLL